MPNKVLKNESFVSVRLDDVYTNNEKHLILPYTKPDGTDSFFGSFKFLNPKEARATLKEAIKLLGADEDTFFEGKYAKWIEDNYGIQLRVGNRVKFYSNVNSYETVPDLDIRNYIYSIELHLTKTKDNGVYLKVARAISLRPSESKYVDSLYEENDSPF